MDGQELQIGSVFALALYKKIGGNGLFWLFNTRVRDGNPSLHDSILTQASKIYSNGGTDTGAPIRKLRLDKEVVDNIIMITDEQQNSGNSFFAELLQYRRSINPRVKTFIIDISGYRQAMVPKDDPNTFYIYGWSDQILSYISKASKGFGTIVDAIKAKRK
jgi:60 kDa SS-A/Ro ribonucleoprotein